MDNTYWNNQGRYQAEYTRLSNELVPMSGKCETVAGELIRAVGRLGYDFYNNGMGNDTSGALNFLLEQDAISYQAFRTIYPFTRGQLYEGAYRGDELQVAIEGIVDSTIEFIQQHRSLLTEQNTQDMLDLSEGIRDYCEDCGEELDELSWNGECRECEEMALWG